VPQDISEVTASLLEAESRKLAESQAKLQSDFEAHEAKFKADLEVVAPQKPKGPANSGSAGSWFLARKSWAWLRRD
jgi:hypothetical protein